MKRLFKFFLSIFLLFTIVGCSNNGNNSDINNNESNPQEEVKPTPSKPENKPKPEDKPNPDSKPDSKPDEKPESKPEEKPKLPHDGLYEGNETVTYTFEDITYTINEQGIYNRKYEVAIYIHFFHKLPQNYYTKKESTKYNIPDLWNEENKLAIGGDRFGNREGLLPYGKTYTECDIYNIDDYNPRRRGKHRIVFDNEFTIYYTSDHYASFEEIVFYD